MKKLQSPSRPWDVNADKKGPQEGRTEDHTSLYTSAAWRRDRAAYLAKYPLCVECSAKGKIKLATVCDHKVPVRQGGDFWSWDNRQGLCDSCHNSKSGKERHKK